ncbi:MAG: hypothetical protein PHI88_00855 [Candidatus Pacebacteria bacterium]|nr:hypothetical protein [Candidatus Paceibacterota bacterium]
MSENLGENNPFENSELSTESEESRLQKEMERSMDEIERIMKEINEVHQSTLDQNQAEKIILEKLVPSMDEAVKKSREVTDQWLESIRKSQKEYEKGLEK